VLNVKSKKWSQKGHKMTHVLTMTLELAHALTVSRLSDKTTLYCTSPAPPITSFIWLLYQTNSSLSVQ